jgi:hypothetical protein
MAKRASQAADAEADATDHNKEQRQMRRLQRQLAKTTEIMVKRTHQLEVARERRASLEAAVAALRGPASDRQPGPRSTDSGGHAGAGRGPEAFCLRERRMVVLLEPTPYRMKNGRAAVMGRCDSCGARVTTTTRATVAEYAGTMPVA